MFMIFSTILFFTMKGCFKVSMIDKRFSGISYNSRRVKSFASSESYTLVGNRNSDSFASFSCLAIFMISSSKGDLPVKSS